MPFQNKLQKCLRDKTIALGLFIQMTGAEVMDILGFAGFEFAVIDMEHGPFGIETMAKMVRASAATGIAPICRVPEISAAVILTCLDVGAHGVLVPQIRTAEDARSVVKMAKYPPLGARGFCSGVRAAGFKATSEYTRAANEKTMVIALIENKEAVKNFGSILDVEGIDAVLIGPGDLSHSLGHPGEWSHPEVRNPIREMIQIAAAKGMPAGMHAKTREDFHYWMDQGARFFTCGMDGQVLRIALEGIAAEIRGPSS